MTLLGLAAIPGSAQFDEIGIKLGPSLTTLHSAFETNRSLPSMVLGAYAPIKINQRLLFQPEFELALMGAGREMDNENTVELRTLYARIPLTLRYRITNRLQLGAGLQAGYLLMASQIYDSEMTDVREFIKPIDIALIGGASLILGQSTDLSVRYIYGMTSILKDDQLLFPTNRAVQLTLGLRISRMKGKSGFRRRK